MIKLIYIFTSVVSVFITTLFFLPEQEVTVTQKAPLQVTAGQEFFMELTISKGLVDGYSRLQQSLPEGFKVEPLSIGRAKFVLDNRFVKFIWFALPSEPVFTISYKVTVDSTVHGEQTIGGIFSYIEKDKTKTIDVTPVTIMVTNTSTTVMPFADAVKKGQEDEPSSDNGAIEIIRNMPDQISGNKEFMVELTVKNKSAHGAAKISEHIPQGWVAEKVEASGALFKTQDSLVKFIWVALPKDSVFKVSYRVKPGKNVEALQSIYGTFAFDYKGTTRSFDYFPSEVAGRGIKTYAPADITPATEPIATDQPVASAIKENISQNPQPKETLLASATTLSSPETGVMYKVQIAACRKDVKDINYFNQHYHLQENVGAEMHDGWHKYVIGSFNDYRNARDMRTNTKEKVAGAFVVAYNNGQRITVREALTVTKQKWVQ